jgi:hypothetical protein
LNAVEWAFTLVAPAGRLATNTLTTTNWLYTDLATATNRSSFYLAVRLK